MFSTNKIKIIASLLSAFILLVGIIVIMSSNIANDLLNERIENQFLSEAFGRGRQFAPYLRYIPIKSIIWLTVFLVTKM